MSFVSDVAKKMGLPHDTDSVDKHPEHAAAHFGEGSLPQFIVSSPQNCFTNMDIDSNRRQS